MRTEHKERGHRRFKGQSKNNKLQNATAAYRVRLMEVWKKIFEEC